MFFTIPLTVLNIYFFEVSQKIAQGQSHKDKNTLCHNHVISVVCTLNKHSP